MQSQPLDATSIYNRFMTLVYNQVVGVPAYTATWHNSSYPVVGSPSGYFGYSQLGPAAEPTFSASDIQATQSEKITSVIFHRLHLMALRMTRVRPASYYYTFGTFTLNFHQTRLAAFNYSIYFQMPPIPGSSSHPSGLGQRITQAGPDSIDNFLIQLRTAIQSVRTATPASIIATHCHSNCHSSCHGSRSRR